MDGQEISNNVVEEDERGRVVKMCRLCKLQRHEKEQWKIKQEIDDQHRKHLEAGGGRGVSCLGRQIDK